MIEESIWGQGATALADAVRARGMSAAEILEVFLGRIDEHNPKIGAFVAVDPDGARKQAARIDDLVEQGEDPGPLAGVPVGVKDLEDAAGLPTRRGSLVFGADPATSDSIQVERLRRAGAVIVGKTATPEFGSLAYTWSRAHGASRNPWNLELTPGGSSGGSAAAVAAGLVPLATASDGGGSIRIPAGYCGIPGLKPTTGTVPAAVRQQLVTLTSRGVVTANIPDLARALDVVAGEDPRDPGSLPKPASFEAALTRDSSSAPSGRRLRAVWSATLGFGWCDPQVEKIARTAAETFIETAGLLEVEHLVDLPDCGPAWASLWALNYFTELASLWPRRQGDLTPVVCAVLEAGAGLTAEDLRAAAHRRLQLFQQVGRLFEHADLLITPTMPSPAFPADGPMPLPGGGDSASEVGTESMAGVCFTYPFNLTGHPAITIPAGMDQRGAPVGLQVIGPRFSDHRLLALARVVERMHAWPRLDL